MLKSNELAIDTINFGCSLRINSKCKYNKAECNLDLFSQLYCHSRIFFEDSFELLKKQQEMFDLVLKYLCKVKECRFCSKETWKQFTCHNRHDWELHHYYDNLIKTASLSSLKQLKHTGRIEIITAKEKHTLAPSWNIIDGWKSGKFHWKKYDRMYVNLLNSSEKSMQLLNNFEKYVKSGHQLVLVCFESEGTDWYEYYCKQAQNCHRHIVKRLLMNRLSPIKGRDFNVHLTFPNPVNPIKLPKLKKRKENETLDGFI